MVVSVASLLVSAVATQWAEIGARHLTAVRGWQVVPITAAYLGLSATVRWPHGTRNSLRQLHSPGWG
jgi:hypothetical protein